MAITKKLFYLLVSDIETVSGKAAFQDLCREKKLKLWQPKEVTKKTHQLTDIVKKSRFQRTQYLTIIENWQLFVVLLKDHSKVGRYAKVERFCN